MNREIDQQVIAQEGLSEEQQLVPHGDGRLTEASYRLMLSRTYLKAVGAIQNSSRGVWALTDYGRSLTQAQAEEIPQRVRAVCDKAEPAQESCAQPDRERTAAGCSAGCGSAEQYRSSGMAGLAA